MRRPLIIVITLAALVLAFVMVGRFVPWLDQRWVQSAIVVCALIVLTAATRGALRDVLLLSCSLVIGFTVLEGVARWLEPPATAWTEPGLREKRAYLGFGPTKPGIYTMRKTAADGRVIFEAKATIDDNLLRRTIAPAGPGALSVFGDSFTFGAGINDKDTFTQSIADATHRRFPVLNLGFSAWSPAQNLVTLQKNLDDQVITGSRRFVLMTAPWHVERTACKAFFVRDAPRYVLRDGAIVLAGACGDQLSHSTYMFLRSFAFFRVFVEPRLNAISHGDAETYFAIVDAFVRTAKEKYGVATTIIVLPSPPGFLKPIGFDDAAYFARLKKSGADLLVETFPLASKNNPYVITDDGHPTGLANRTLARLLLEHLQSVEPGWLDEASAAKP